MSEPTIRFPVRCPKCAQEALGEYPIAEVAAALVAPGEALRLHAPCHNIRWCADAEDLSRIREYLREWMKAQPSTLQTTVSDQNSEA